MKNTKTEKTEKIRPSNKIVCEQCGRKILKERLKAIPDTTLCINCATESEYKNGVDVVVPLFDYDPSELLDTISDD
jgi:RNA polymerase-binding transcription factor DksA